MHPSPPRRRFGRSAGTPRYGRPGTLLAGKGRDGLRAMWRANQRGGPPPGKQWRYRDGQCTLDVQLYPDVRQNSSELLRTG